MELVNFSPENELEIFITDTKKGGRSIDELINKLIESDLYIPSMTEVEQDGSGFTPLLLGEIANPLVAAFSSLSRPGLHGQRAGYVLSMQGNDFFLRLPNGYGLAINPGYTTQLIISEDIISDKKQMLLNTVSHAKKTI